jgi:hypothetical protein
LMRRPALEENKDGRTILVLLTGLVRQQRKVL